MLKSIDRMYQTMLAELGQRALDGLVSTLTREGGMVAPD